MNDDVENGRNRSSKTRKLNYAKSQIENEISNRDRREPGGSSQVLGLQCPSVFLALLLHTRPTMTLVCAHAFSRGCATIGLGTGCHPVFFFYFPCHLLSSPFCSLSLLVVTQIRGHMAGSSPPPTHYGACLAFFIARRFQLFLPSSTRVEFIHIQVTIKTNLLAELKHQAPN